MTFCVVLVLKLLEIFATVPLSAVHGSNEIHLSEAIRQDTRLVQCDNSHMKMSFANLDYAFAGYDVVMGYPLTIARDPGFRNAIFKADYANGKPNGDCRYMLPKGINAVPDVSCDVSFSSDIIKTKSDFFKSLAVSANVQGGGFGFEFSASASYQKSTSELASREYVYVISKATCTSHFSMLEYTNPPPFSDSFLKSAKALASADATDQDIAKFVTKYGTHFLDEVTFGSSYTQEHRMTTDTFENMNSEKFGVAVQAGYSGAISVGGSFSLDSEQREAASSFSKKVKTNTVTIGSAPPGDGDAMTWASATKDNPVPIKYRLRPITELFTAKFMTGVDFDDYSTVKTKLELAKPPYIACKSHQSKNPAISCDQIDESTSKEVSSIGGGYPHHSSNVDYTLGDGMTCEVLCKRTNCIGYFPRSGGRCALFFEPEPEEPESEESESEESESEEPEPQIIFYEWRSSPSIPKYYILAGNMKDIMRFKNYIAKKVDGSTKLYAYKFPLRNPNQEVTAGICNLVCRGDALCKAMRYDGTDCVIYHKTESLPSEHVQNGIFIIQPR